MGLRVPHIHPSQCLQAGAEPLRFFQIGGHVQRMGHSPLRQEKTGLDGHRVDRPGHAVAADASQQAGISREIAQPQAGHGITLGHGVQQQHVGISGRLGRREQRAQREVLIGLVDDEADLRIAADEFFHPRLVRHAARGVVGIAHPEHPHVFGQQEAFAFAGQAVERKRGMAMQQAGIAILAERGLQNGRAGAPESLCHQIDGFGGSVGHTHFIGIQPQFPGQGRFQRIGLGFGIGRERAQSAVLPLQKLAQMVLQFRQIRPAIDVRTEIGRYRPGVFVGVVSVSVNHVASVFGKQAAG